MRTFYIFKINKLLNPLYEKRTTSVFKMLDRINKLDTSEKEFGRSLYKKVIIPIDKKNVNNYLLMNHMNDFYYTKNSNVHLLSSTLEESKLFVHNTYIKIVTTCNISTFFRDIFNMDKDMFVVDFKNRDYFYIDDLKEKLLA